MRISRLKKMQRKRLIKKFRLKPKRLKRQKMIQNKRRKMMWIEKQNQMQ